MFFLIFPLLGNNLDLGHEYGRSDNFARSLGVHWPSRRVTSPILHLHVGMEICDLRISHEI